MNYELLKENHTKVSYKQMTKKIVTAGCVATGAFLFGMDAEVLANTASLNEKAEKLYFDTFIGIAKWIIIGKGGWDIVTRALQEDFDGAKRSILQYMLIFAVLMGLPWSLTLVEDIFREV